MQIPDMVVEPLSIALVAFKILMEADVISFRV